MVIDLSELRDEYGKFYHQSGVISALENLSVFSSGGREYVSLYMFDWGESVLDWQAVVPTEEYLAICKEIVPMPPTESLNKAFHDRVFRAAEALIYKGVKE